MIIEVKSLYSIGSYESQTKSLTSGIDKLKLKRQSVLDAGYKFNLIIRKTSDRNQYNL